MEQIKLNEKYTLPGEERYFIIEENAGKTMAVLYEADGQKIITCPVEKMSFDEVISTLKLISKGADKVKDFISGTVKKLKDELSHEAPECHFKVDLTPTECNVNIKGKGTSIASLLATFLHVNPEYVKIFDFALKLHKEQKEKIVLIRSSVKGSKYQA
jgi:hypothetical protein